MAIQIKRIGHVGILVSDFERSFRFYTEVLGCTVTSRRTRPDGSESAFLQFEEMHHDFVIGTAPKGVDVASTPPEERLVQQISFEVENRDEFLKALAHIHSKEIEPINGPLVHGFEADGPLEGSGSHAFYFLDPDGNRLEIYTEMMKVPNGEEFPRQEYIDAMRAHPYVPRAQR